MGDNNQFSFGSEGDFARLYNFAPRRDGKLEGMRGGAGGDSQAGEAGGSDNVGGRVGDAQGRAGDAGKKEGGESAKHGDAGKGDKKSETTEKKRESEVDEKTQKDPAKKQDEKKETDKAEKDKPSEKDKPAASTDASRELSAETQRHMQELAQKFGARDGVDPARAKEFQQNLEDTAKRVHDNPYIKDPNKEMERIVGAMDRVLSSDGKVEGKQVHSAEDQNKIVEGMARRSANPEKNVNQGAHNTCPMESKARQVLETNPADYCETVASVATTGKATLGPQGDKHETKVHTDSLRLDREARNMGANSDGKRDASGQLFDLAAAQSYWDTQTPPSGGRFEYRQGSNPGQGSTGESLVSIDKAGNEKVVGDNAMLTAHRVAEMSYRVDGDQGVFAHTSLAVGGRLNNFSNDKELAEKMEAYQKETGRPAQMLVFAGNLPGQAGRSSGHDLHAMTAWTKDGKFYGDNQWGAQSDSEVQGMSGSQMMAATQVPDRIGGPARPQDDIPPDQRIVDPGNSIPKEDRAPQKNKMDEDAEKLRKEEEKRKQEEAIKDQKEAAAFEEAHSRWQAAKKQAEADGVNFDKPEPVRGGVHH